MALTSFVIEERFFRLNVSCIFFAELLSGRRSVGRDSVNLGSRLSDINIINANNGLLTNNDPLNELASSTAFFPDLDFTQSGYLYKKSNKKLHKQWQKRRCRIEDGHFWLSHSDVFLSTSVISLLPSPSTSVCMKFLIVSFLHF